MNGIRWFGRSTIFVAESLAYEVPCREKYPLTSDFGASPGGHFNLRNLHLRFDLDSASELKPQPQSNTLRQDFLSPSKNSSEHFPDSR